MKKYSARLFSFVFALLALALAAVNTGCGSIKGAKALADCQFEYKGIGNLHLCGIDISNAKGPADIGITDLAKIGRAIGNKSLMVSLDVNVGVRNPNDKVARLDGLDYRLFIDDTQVTNGSMQSQFSVGAGQSAVMPLGFNFNLWDLLSGQSSGKVLSFAFDLLTDQADNSRVKLSLKPYFTIAGKVVKFPAFVTIGGDKIMPGSKK